MVSKTIDVGSIPTAPVMIREPLLTFFISQENIICAIRYFALMLYDERIHTMKKLTTLLTVTLLMIGILSGCGESTPLLTATDYELDLASDKTARGIAPGDNAEAFLSAYGEYRIFTSIDGGDYEVLDASEIPFDSAVSTLLPTFFIDGLPIDPDTFCEENEVSKTDLLAYLTSDQYLSSHTVVYFYLLFTWENGVITDIRSEYMDYNEDAAFYKSA